MPSAGDRRHAETAPPPPPRARAAPPPKGSGRAPHWQPRLPGRHSLPADAAESMARQPVTGGMNEIGNAPVGPTAKERHQAIGRQAPTGRHAHPGGERDRRPFRPVSVPPCRSTAGPSIRQIPPNAHRRRACLLNSDAPSHSIPVNSLPSAGHTSPLRPSAGKARPRTAR